MEISKRGKIELCCHEGVSLQPYDDSVGVVTIGIGATVSEIADLPKWPKTKSITIVEAFDLFDKSLEKYEKALNSCLTVEITQQQFDALVSMCYNIGTGGIKKSTLIKRINSKDPIDLIKKEFDKWHIPASITSRRNKERDLYATGQYQQSGKAQLYNTLGTGKLHHSATTTINILDYIK